MAEKGLTIKDIVVEELGQGQFKRLDKTAYETAIPIIPQDFSMGAVLPAVLYMFRWDRRRGVGKFIDVFGNPHAINNSDKASTTKLISQKLTQDPNLFSGFELDVHINILADLLLTFCLENTKHSEGRDKPVQRVYPTHYFASWIDLPVNISHLRNVPETLVSILSQGKNYSKGPLQIGTNLENNLLLSLFGAGTNIKGESSSIKSDFFEEQHSIGIDQLLTIRISQFLGEAPKTVKGSNLSEQQMIAEVSEKNFFEDFNIFLRAYGKIIPRLSLLPMIESCLSIGFASLYLSTLSMILYWEETGELPKSQEQSPWSLFVDCSLSQNYDIRRFSELCMDDLVRKLARLPVCFMCLRILDNWAQSERIGNLPNGIINPSERINFLGKLLRGELEESRDLVRDIRKKCMNIYDSAVENNEADDLQILQNDTIHPVWRLAEVMFSVCRPNDVIKKSRLFMDNCLMAGQPNGIAFKRKAAFEGKANADRRSIILTNTALDYLVHRHLRKGNKNTAEKSLSISEFLRILQERYGFYIDQSPPGLSVPSELLQKNRAFLEHRLRDMGLFVGVNDAESMKRLKARYRQEETEN